MTDQPITYNSSRKQLSQAVKVLDKTDKNGINCVWSGGFIYSQKQGDYDIRFSWSFDWNRLQITGTDGLSGHITVTSPEKHFGSRTIDVDLTASPQVIETTMSGLYSNYAVSTFEYNLLPYPIQSKKNPRRCPIQEEVVSYDEMFLPSELNDTILVIDEKRLHVNSVFLSIHSDFFRTLFSSKFKEGQMEEIPIKDVSYADFGLLMSTIYPKTVYPNDKMVEKLFELADRFLILSVIGHVEYHLLHNTHINSEKIIWIADKYGMPKLFEKCIRELNTIEKAKKLQTSPEYEKLSNEAKAKILDRMFKMI